MTTSINTVEPAFARPKSPTTISRTPSKKPVYPQGKNPGLRYVEPYYHPYRTFAKQRWFGRELLEVVSTEFRDR